MREIRVGFLQQHNVEDRKTNMLRLAEGIEDSSNVVHVAMSNLAADILKTSEKVISNKVDFGILDIKQELCPPHRQHQPGNQQCTQCIGRC